MSGMLVAGQGFVAAYKDDGTVGRLVGPFEITEFRITPGADTKDMISRSPGTYGQVKASVQLPKPTELSIKFGEVDRTTLTMAFLGEQVAANQAAGHVTNQAVSVVERDVWLELGKTDVSNVVVTNDYNDVTYHAGTDYEVNERLGLIKIKSTGIIGLTTPVMSVILHVTYDHAAVTGININGSVKNQIKAKLVLDGVNLVDNSPVSVTIPQAVLSPNGGFDFMASDFSEVPLTGKAVIASGETSPYTVKLR